MATFQDRISKAHQDNFQLAFLVQSGEREYPFLEDRGYAWLPRMSAGDTALFAASSLPTSSVLALLTALDLRHDLCL